jgi:hypothetical protein
MLHFHILISIASIIITAADCLFEIIWWSRWFNFTMSIFWQALTELRYSLLLCLHSHLPRLILILPLKISKCLISLIISYTYFIISGFIWPLLVGFSLLTLCAYIRAFNFTHYLVTTYLASYFLDTITPINYYFNYILLISGQYICFSHDKL